MSVNITFALMLAFPLLAVALGGLLPLALAGVVDAASDAIRG